MPWGAKMDFSAIVDSLPWPVVIIKADGRIVYANPSAREIFGDATHIPSSLLGIIDNLPSRWEWEFKNCKFTYLVTSARLEENLILHFQDRSEVEAIIEAKKEAEERFQVFSEGLSHAVALIQEVDGVLQHVYINSAFTERTGYTLEDLRQRPFYELIDPAYHPLIKEKAAKRLAGDRTHGYYEFRIKKKDGSLIWVRMVTSYVVHQGKPAILVSAHDITDLKEAQEVLKNKSEVFSNIINALPFATFAVDMEGKVIGWNKTMETLTGVNAREIIGQGERAYSKALYGDGRPILIDKLLNHAIDLGDTYKDVVERDGVWYARGFIRLPNGQESFYLAVANSLKDGQGNTVGAVESIVDLTRQYAAEEALQESEKRFRALAEESPDVIMLFDREGRHLYCNSAIRRYTKLKPEDFIGKTHRDLNLPAGLVDEVEGAIKEVFRTGETMRRQLLLRNGLCFDWLLSPIKSKNGEVTHVITASRDITEIKKMEEALIRSEKMEAIGNLAGGIAHDFNNILQAVLGYATLIQMNHPKESDDHVRAQLIINAATSAMELIRRLLGFARSTPGDVQPFDINDEITKVVQMYGRTRKGIELHVKLGHNLPSIEGDRVQMEQVFLNILVNAGQAMPEGGNIFVETEAVEIDDRTARIHRVQAGHYVKISITDTGIGMDDETKAKIFEPFFTTKSPEEGTGLGLTTAYGIVKAHHGFINVYSELGRGTTFSIYLPASGKAVFESKERGKITPTGHETILVVDDELPVLDVAADILSYLGYRVLKAASGEEAIRIYGEKKDDIDLVILDMIMPRMTGKDVFLRLKEINPSVRACITTGYTQTGKALEMLDLGVKAFIQKPYTISELANRVREILD